MVEKRKKKKKILHTARETRERQHSSSVNGRSEQGRGDLGTVTPGDQGPAGLWLWISSLPSSPRASSLFLGQIESLPVVFHSRPNFYRCILCLVLSTKVNEFMPGAYLLDERDRLAWAYLYWSVRRKIFKIWLVNSPLLFVSPFPPLHVHRKFGEKDAFLRFQGIIDH